MYFRRSNIRPHQLDVQETNVSMPEFCRSAPNPRGSPRRTPGSPRAVRGPPKLPHESRGVQTLRRDDDDVLVKRRVVEFNTAIPHCQTPRLWTNLVSKRALLADEKTRSHQRRRVLRHVVAFGPTELLSHQACDVIPFFPQSSSHLAVTSLPRAELRDDVVHSVVGINPISRPRASRTASSGRNRPDLCP